MAIRNELVEAIAARYARSDRAEKARMLEEFVAVTDFTVSMRCVCCAAERQQSRQVSA
jgi:hypothetical protein